jgi:hypothetical protein
LNVTARFAQGAESAEGVIFLNRRERRRFKNRYALRAAGAIYREAAGWFSVAGLSAATEKDKYPLRPSRLCGENSYSISAPSYVQIKMTLLVIPEDVH